jgi:hypothetical protein
MTDLKNILQKKHRRDSFISAYLLFLFSFYIWIRIHWMKSLTIYEEGEIV